MAICLARGVNDTPKLVALLLLAHSLRASQGSVVLIALAMALGGVLFAKKVAQTMSQRVTKMDHTSGLAANRAFKPKDIPKLWANCTYSRLRIFQAIYVLTLDYTQGFKLKLI